MGDTKINFSIHHYNAGDLVLARTFLPQLSPHSKYYETTNIWFNEDIVKRRIKVFKCDTFEQIGYLFAKSLPRTTFEYLSKKIMG